MIRTRMYCTCVARPSFGRTRGDIEVEQIPAEMVRRHHPSERNTLVSLRWKQETSVLFLVIGCIQLESASGCTAWRILPARNHRRLFLSFDPRELLITADESEVRYELASTGEHLMDRRGDWLLQWAFHAS